jgi:hypothetical protein
MAIKTFHLMVKSRIWFFLPAWLFLLQAIAYAVEPANHQPARDPSACELKIVGKHVEKLSLADEQGNLKEFDQPGPSVFLPPGRYQIKEMRVQWDDNGQLYTDTDVNYLTLVPSGVCQLMVGTSQTPKVSVTRQGSALTLNYNLLEAGPPYSSAPRTTQPQIAFYSKGGQKIASEAFVFG